jgi:hypothetical protein
MGIGIGRRNARLFRRRRNLWTRRLRNWFFWLRWRRFRLLRKIGAGCAKLNVRRVIDGVPLNSLESLVRTPVFSPSGEASTITTGNHVQDSG